MSSGGTTPPPVRCEGQTRNPTNFMAALHPTPTTTSTLDPTRPSSFFFQPNKLREQEGDPPFRFLDWGEFVPSKARTSSEKGRQGEKDLPPHPLFPSRPSVKQGTRRRARARRLIPPGPGSVTPRAALPDTRSGPCRADAWGATLRRHRGKAK